MKQNSRYVWTVTFENGETAQQEDATSMEVLTWGKAFGEAQEIDELIEEYLK